MQQGILLLCIWTFSIVYLENYELYYIDKQIDSNRRELCNCTELEDNRKMLSSSTTSPKATIPSTLQCRLQPFTIDTTPLEKGTLT